MHPSRCVPTAVTYCYATGTGTMKQLVVCKVIFAVVSLVFGLGGTRTEARFVGFA